MVRLCRVLAGVVWGLWVVHTRFPGWPLPRRQAEVQAWSRRMLQALGVGLRVEGHAPAEGPLLVVANHVSWLDILVLNAARPARFVSKADVKHWPLLGRLVAGAGTLFIERESRRDALRVVHHMAEALRAGGLLAVFPEGTTGEGRRVLPFHANLLQAAVATGTPVQAVTLAYRHAPTGQPSEAPVYVGDTTLVASVWRTLTAPQVEACVVHALPQQARGRDRRAWAADLQALVDGHLQTLFSPRGVTS